MDVKQHVNNFREREGERVRLEREKERESLERERVSFTRERGGKKEIVCVCVYKTKKDNHDY